jgi:hypothetical protein
MRFARPACDRRRPEAMANSIPLTRESAPLKALKIVYTQI